MRSLRVRSRTARRASAAAPQAPGDGVGVVDRDQQLVDVLHGARSCSATSASPSRKPVQQVAAQLRGGLGQPVEPGRRPDPNVVVVGQRRSRRPGPRSARPRRTPSRRRGGSRRRPPSGRDATASWASRKAPSASARWTAACSGRSRWTARMALPAARITRRQLASPASRATFASASSLTARSTGAGQLLRPGRLPPNRTQLAARRRPRSP